MTEQLHVLNHPVLQHKLGILRDQKTNTLTFRTILQEVSSVLAYEATRALPVIKKSITTPVADCVVSKIANPPIIVSVLRAGNGMVDGILNLLPLASVGHIGMYRDHDTSAIVEYYFRLPKRVINETILLADPMIANGDTILESIKRLQQQGVGTIKILNILISQKAVNLIKQQYPAIEIYTLSVEPSLNEHGYLVPGLGDAGDRLYNTNN